MFSALIKDNFLSNQDAQYLIDTAVASELWENAGHEFWNNRVINYYSMLAYDKKAAEIMLDANIKCGNIIRNNYAIPEIYSDTLQIVRWFPDMEQPPHADDMTNTDVTGLEHRAFGSIIYLNDNYEGGKTYYPNFDISITPKAGTAVLFDSMQYHASQSPTTGKRGVINFIFWKVDDAPPSTAFHFTGPSPLDKLFPFVEANK